MRLGVHTGVVVVDDVGTGGRHEPLALGETPNIAVPTSAPNTLMISAATYHLIEGYFTCEVLGEQPLRGLAQPLRGYRVLGTSGAQSRLEVAASRGLTPLVGRVPEVGLLVERWGRVKAGMGQVVVLTGEAALGQASLPNESTATQLRSGQKSEGPTATGHPEWWPLRELYQSYH